jgi:RsiW-degrading membrane proteinase PrsW (M82 family)
VSTLATILPLFAEQVDAAEEGKRVVIGMLITGLIFIGVIALGETSKWLRHRRRRAY